MTVMHEHVAGERPAACRPAGTGLGDRRMTQGQRFAGFHAGFAALAAAGFVAHLIANFFVEQVYWLPEYVWGGSLALSILAVYAGCSASARAEADRRGPAIASAIVGTALLLGLMYSGITWLFVPPDMSGVAM